MLVGVPKEIKHNEYRVGLTPEGAKELILRGHRVFVESQAGSAVGLSDQRYIDVGVEVVSSAAEIFAQAELIVKVKEPQANECAMLREGQLLFAYLHLAADPEQTSALVNSGSICIAYETVSDSAGGLPLLSPMSEIAGRIAVQQAAHCLEKAQGGSGILLGGVAGVRPAHITIIGAGTVGLNAARIAVGMGADVSLLDRSLARLKYVDELFAGRIKTLFSTAEAIEQQLKVADAIIGAVLIAGAAAPKLISRSQLSLIKPGSVLVDVAIDQGGCFETSRPTTHQQPTFSIDGITHYCVANIPSCVAQTATYALTNTSLPYVLRLADQGMQALVGDAHFSNGLNIYKGQVTCRAVAEATGRQYLPVLQVLSQ